MTATPHGCTTKRLQAPRPSLSLFSQTSAHDQGANVKPIVHTAKPAADISRTGRFTRWLIALCALASVFALATTTAAQAQAPTLIPDGSFNPGLFPEGIAVDQTSGDVYIAALAFANINKFDASGSPLAPPSPFGEGNFSSAAVNPTNGDLYVLNALPNEMGNATINTYDPGTGAPLGAPFAVPPSSNYGEGFYTVVQIGVDPETGDVYVPVTPENEVLEYSPTGTPLHTFTGGAGVGALNRPTGVAVDSTGDLWVADTGNNRIEELNPSDTPVEVNGKPVEIKSEGVRDAIALDGHGDVLAIDKNGTDFCGSVEHSPPCSHLVEYTTAGVQVADVGAGFFETGQGYLPLPPLVAVDEKSGLVYVTDGKGEKVWVFAQPTPPRVENELSAEVTTSEAKLGALVNSGGIATTYRFEYGTTSAYGQSTPFAQGSVGEGLASHTVWAAASGLAPGTTYHYRVVAANGLGEATGPDRTFTTLTAEQAACRPNEQFRGGFSATLPDCRAYELVTPATKTSVQIRSSEPDAEGDAAVFETEETLPGSPTGSDHYVATRTPDGWSSEDIMPLESYSGVTCLSVDGSVEAFSDEGSRELFSFGHETRASEPGGSGLSKQECNAEGLQVVPGEPVGYQNLLLRDNATGGYQLVNVPPAGVTPADAHFRGASADLSHVVFSELAPLTPPAPFATVGGPEDVYEWDEGALRLLTVLPDGTAVEGALAVPSSVNGSQSISGKGSRILFTSGGALYMREDGQHTVQVDKSQVSGVSGGGGSFQAMNAEGSNVLFTDENQLTPGSTAVPGKPDLYECVLPEGASRCELSDLTAARAGENADVQMESVSAFGSQDSSHVYFVAKGVLAANKREYTNSEGHTVVEGAEPEQENLYLRDGSTTTFIAGDGSAGVVSPDGKWFAFTSAKSLTGYDNTPPGDGRPEHEIFLYSASSNQLECASCNPSGESPMAGANETLPRAPQRPLSDGGRLFFDTPEALVPSDTNNQVDVYEYEDGQPSLISSGTSPRASEFDAASENGGNVFFLSRQQLLPQDDTGGEARVIYDARVYGGFPAVSSPPSCATADACRAPVAALPSVFGVPPSATFSGAGNLAPSPAAPVVKPKPKALVCGRGFVRKKARSKSRCVRKSARKARKSAHAKKRGH
jgi:DNA-binding beta-propeller fold protein YncE